MIRPAIIPKQPSYFSSYFGIISAKIIYFACSVNCNLRPIESNWQFRFAFNVPPLHPLSPSFSSPGYQVSRSRLFHHPGPQGSTCRWVFRRPSTSSIARQSPASLSPHGQRWQRTKNSLVTPPEFLILCFYYCVLT
jgi:hypothetical protein